MYPSNVFIFGGVALGVDLIIAFFVIMAILNRKQLTKISLARVMRRAKRN